MRLAGGILRGRKLKVPNFVRPTQERVREAVFSMLREKLIGARTLDLFAGSGALGLEAYSRGAASVCWVEQNKQVFSVLKENISCLCTENTTQTQLVFSDVFRYIRAHHKENFDIIMVDPPYKEGLLEKMLHALDSSSLLKSGAWIVFEQCVEDTVKVFENWELLKNKSYGDARILIFGQRTNQ